MFESNDDRPTQTSVSHSRQNSGAAVTSAATIAHAPEEQADPDQVVSQVHWQRITGLDACADPMCGKRLGGSTGQVNCRHCGKLFCEEHTMYQMKLSRAANHEPSQPRTCARKMTMAANSRTSVKRPSSKRSGAALSVGTRRRAPRGTHRVTGAGLRAGPSAPVRRVDRGAGAGRDRAGDPAVRPPPGVLVPPGPPGGLAGRRRS